MVVFNFKYTKKKCYNSEKKEICLMETKKEIGILVVEDEENARKYCVELLQEDYSNVYEAASVVDAKKSYYDKNPGIILLDLTLPDGSGIDFLRYIRKEDQQTKVIVLTAHSDLPTVLSATDLKLTKYLIKPLKMRQLQEALSEAVRELQKFKIERNDIVFLKDGYTWDKKNKQLYKDTDIVILTNKEHALLEILCKSPNIPISKEQIIYTLWSGSDTQYAVSNLKTLIKNIRKKISAELIVSVYGTGYMVALS